VEIQASATDSSFSITVSEPSSGMHKHGAVFCHRCSGSPLSYASGQDHIFEPHDDGPFVRHPMKHGLYTGILLTATVSSDARTLGFRYQFPNIVPLQATGVAILCSERGLVSGRTVEPNPQSSVKLRRLTWRLGAIRERLPTLVSRSNRCLSIRESQFRGVRAQTGRCRFERNTLAVTAVSR
jgi:hypothetical protein